MNETEIFSYLVSPPTMVGLIIAFAEALKILEGLHLNIYRFLT